MHLSGKLASKLVFPIRAVEDHHVDRTGVEVQQCMKLTVTNCSTGLSYIKTLQFARAQRKDCQQWQMSQNELVFQNNLFRSVSAAIYKKAGLYGLVIMAEVVPPVPIPNTEVKPSSANGTMS